LNGALVIADFGNVNRNDLAVGFPRQAGGAFDEAFACVKCLDADVDPSQRIKALIPNVILVSLDANGRFAPNARSLFGIDGPQASCREDHQDQHDAEDRRRRHPGRRWAQNKCPNAERGHQETLDTDGNRKKFVPEQRPWLDKFALQRQDAKPAWVLPGCDGFEPDAIGFGSASAVRPFRRVVHAVRNPAKAATAAVSAPRTFRA
jgi:hypothetical protein